VIDSCRCHVTCLRWAWPVQCLHFYTGFVVEIQGIPGFSIFAVRRCAGAVFAVVVCPSVCHKPVLYRNDWTNRAGLWHRGFLPPVPHRVVRKYGYLQKLGFFPLRLCPKLRTSKISPRQLDRVVNKTRRRRRRSSLLTTPIRQSTSRGCLLQVGQL